MIYTLYFKQQQGRGVHSVVVSILEIASQSPTTAIGCHGHLISRVHCAESSLGQRRHAEQARGASRRISSSSGCVPVQAAAMTECQRLLSVACSTGRSRQLILPTPRPIVAGARQASPCEWGNSGRLRPSLGRAKPSPSGPLREAQHSTSALSLPKFGWTIEQAGDLRLCLLVTTIPPHSIHYHSRLHCLITGSRQDGLDYPHSESVFAAVSTPRPPSPHARPFDEHTARAGHDGGDQPDEPPRRD